MNEIDNYIGQFEPEIQLRLTELRQLFFEVLPECEESIRYNMPAFKVGKSQLYFSACNKHIGFYPVSKQTALEDRIEEYREKGTKDSLHFMHNKPVPIDLVKDIIRLKAEVK